MLDMHERSLEKEFHSSKIQKKPDYQELKKILLNCLEQHYGNLSDAVTQGDEFLGALREIKRIVDSVQTDG